MKKNCYLLLRLGLFALVLSHTLAIQAIAAPPAKPRIHLLTKIALGGEGGWDYLTIDSSAHRLYVTRGSHVTVIDTLKSAIAGDIPNTPGVHGVAVAPNLGKGFTSNGRDNSVTVFDLKSLKELKRIPVGMNPDAILYEMATSRLFTFNGRSNDITALDAVTGKVLGTIPVGGKPEFAVSDDKGMIFCNVEDTSEVVSIDARTLKVMKHWKIAPGDGPSGLAIDKVNHRLFSVCGNKKMTVLDYDSGKVIASPTIGNGPDAAIFDPDLKIAISSNGQDGNMTIVREVDKNTFKVIDTVATQTGARTMTLDPKTHRIYLISASFKKPAPGDPPNRRPAMEPNSATILVFGP